MNPMTENQTYTGSVKVMRSYDYCHFEIALGVNEGASLECVDEMRKQAARLADKAVEQYKIAKSVASRAEESVQHLEYLRSQVKHIMEKPPENWTPEQMARVKELQDIAHQSRRRSYDYQDDWSDGFSDDDEAF